MFSDVSEEFAAYIIRLVISPTRTVSLFSLFGFLFIFYLLNLVFDPDGKFLPNYTASH
jgi:hypothetical protein